MTLTLGVDDIRYLPFVISNFLCLSLSLSLFLILILNSHLQISHWKCCGLWIVWNYMIEKSWRR
jgi:hypothetical protein